MDTKTDLQKAAEEQQAMVKSNWDKLNPEIVYSGKAITLPGDPTNMPTEKAIEALNRKLADDEMVFNVHEIIDAYPHDGAVAFVKAMQSLYGWASPVPTPTFFGPKPPQMVSIKTGHRDTDVIQCPVGRFMLPGVDMPVNSMLEFWDDRGQPCFLIHGQIKKKHRHLVLELATETRRIVKEQSIYRGRAIRLSVDEDGDANLGLPPQFMDVANTKESDLLFDGTILEQINTNILVPVKQTARCRELRVPLKRGVLLEGPYGTGKSLTARMTAATCERNGWTFILLDNVRGLRVALEFANRYAPAVVFAEDIDRVAAVRDEAMNDLINTIDGVVSKNSEVMTILTSNFVDNLDPVILRPGRLDAIISLRAPSAPTVEKLIRFYAGSLLDKDVKLAQVAKTLEGQIPASIRECVERAKLGMIGREADSLSAADLLVAADVMKNHLALLNKKVEAPSTEKVLADSLRKVLGNGHSTELDAINANLTVLRHDQVERIDRRTSAILEAIENM